LGDYWVKRLKTTQWRHSQPAELPFINPIIMRESG
jgi:hypothetical protein